ncbi:MAG: T9SS type A sorting domain-containing protein, partial [bacterium]
VDMLKPESGCGIKSDYVEVVLKNTGTDTIAPGEWIFVDYYNNSTNPGKDTLVLTENIFPGDSTIFTFNKVAVAGPGEYYFRIETELFGDIREENDVYYDTVIIGNQPVVVLDSTGTGQITIQAKFVDLDAGPGVNYTYLWHDGSINRRYHVTETFGTYSVTVTDTVSKCFDRDTVSILLFATDVGVKNVLSESEICASEFSDLIVEIENFGTTAIDLKTDLVKVVFDAGTAGYSVDTLTGTFSGTQLYYTMRNVSVNRSDFSAKIYTVFEDDVENSNDTLSKSFVLKKSPSVNWPTDTSSAEPSITLDATQLESGAEYLWEDGSNTSTYKAREVNKDYSVEITYPNGCKGTFTIRVVPYNIPSVESDNQYNVVIYPNPAKERVYLRFENPLFENIMVELMDVNGKVLNNGKWDVHVHDQMEMNVEDYPAGMYFIRLSNTNINTTVKLLLE